VASSDETPHPPATAEFGAVKPGGPTHAYPDVDGLSVKKFSVGPYDNNVYVLSSGGEALIVDGANDADRILSEVAGSKVVGIVQTHGHFDHVQALEKLVADLGVPVHAHPADGKRMPVTTEDLGEGDSLSVGEITIRVMHTPGHTPGSLSFVTGSFLLSGDTLFPGGPGNTDGDPKRFAQVMTSLGRLFALPDDTRVCPGHGLDTFIGRERPHVETWRTRGW
jgi:glyoxylase-like metal-dependent hydrolase (beta-lactamase superfamily II)